RTRKASRSPARPILHRAQMAAASSISRGHTLTLVELPICYEAVGHVTTYAGTIHEAAETGTVTLSLSRADIRGRACGSCRSGRKGAAAFGVALLHDAWVLFATWTHVGGSADSGLASAGGDAAKVLVAAAGPVWLCGVRARTSSRIARPDVVA